MFIEAATTPLAEAAGLPYVGMTTEFVARAAAHRSAGRLIGEFRAVFGVEGASLREAEQFLLGQVRNAAGLDPNALLGKNGSGVSNRINPLNEQLRKILPKEFCQ